MKRRSRKPISAAAVCVLVCMVLAGCGARTAETTNRNMVVAGWIDGPDSFNPLTRINSASAMMADEIYTPLISIGANLRPRWSTSLAYRVDVTGGGKRYVIHLRRGARWTDGYPLNARDVAFTIALISNPGLIHSSAGDFGLMRSVRALDPYTVEVDLRSPSPPFLMNALANDTLPLPAHLLAKYPPLSPQEAAFVNADASFAQHPVTSGPWELLRNVPSSYTILERSPTYWGPKPHLDEIAFRVYPEQDSLYAAVDAGEIDVTDIPPNLWRIHNRITGKHTFITWPWNSTFLLLPNYRDPAIPWIHDERVRQAMMFAINRPFIVYGIMSGQADVLNGPIPTFSPYYDRRVATYPYDPSRARALLDAAGWRMHGGVRVKDGKAMRIVLKTGGATDAVASSIAELVQANLRAVGIDCTLENEEIQTFFQDLHESKFQLALRGLILPPYPDDYYLYYSTQTLAHGGYNEGFVDNPKIDRDILQARTAARPSVAVAALDRYQLDAARIAPVIFLYSVRLAAVVPPNMTGYVLDPLSPAALPMGLQFWELHRNPPAKRS